MKEEPRQASGRLGSPPKEQQGGEGGNIQGGFRLCLSAEAWCNSRKKRIRKRGEICSNIEKDMCTF